MSRLKASKKGFARAVQPRFLAVDFFSGAGGTTRGLIDAGGYVIAGIDKDERCKDTYIHNNSNESIDYSSPRFLQYDIFPRSDPYLDGQQHLLIKDLHDHIEYYRAKVPGVPLLFAICAPCQPFTRLSKKKMSARRKEGRARDAGLLSEAAKFVAKFRPEIVLSENVAAIAHESYGGVWDQFRSDLERLGYVTGTRVVCASRFQIPQHRRRSILLAIRRKLVRPNAFSDLMRNELVVPEDDGSNVIVTVKEALEHLPPLGAGDTHPDVPNHKTRSLSELNLKRLSSAKPGEPNRYLTSTSHGDLTLRCLKEINQRLQQHCFSDVYTRMHPDRPSPTITTKCHSISNGRFGHYAEGQIRGISLREAAILQSFPEDYVFYPTNQIEPIARMIGNAVPPKLAKFYADFLVSCIRARNS